MGCCELVTPTCPDHRGAQLGGGSPPPGRGKSEPSYQEAEVPFQEGLSWKETGRDHRGSEGPGPGASSVQPGQEPGQGGGPNLPLAVLGLGSLRTGEVGGGEDIGESSPGEEAQGQPTLLEPFGASLTGPGAGLVNPKAPEAETSPPHAQRRF